MQSLFTVIVLCVSVLGANAATPTSRPLTTSTHNTHEHGGEHRSEHRDAIAPKRDTTVHGHHHRVRARLDHTINRFAGRAGGKFPISTHDINLRLGLPPEGEHDSAREHVMLVHSEVSTRNVFNSKSEESTKDREQARDQRGDRNRLAHVREPKTHKSLKHHRGEGRGNQGSIGAYDGANGDGGGGGESAGALNSINSASFGAIKEITLGEGSALIAHKQHVVVNTQAGKLHVLPGSAAFVTQIGKTVSVYNMGDAHEGAIHFTLSGRDVAVPVGSELLVTKEPRDKFEEVNPIKGIQTRNPASLGADGESKIFQAEYSPVSALDRIPQFGNLVSSKRPDDRRLATHLIKTASVLLQVEQPFEEEKPTPVQAAGN